LLAAIKGVCLLAQLPAQTAGLQRHLCDSPRKRKRRTIYALPTFAKALS